MQIPWPSPWRSRHTESVAAVIAIIRPAQAGREAAGCRGMTTPVDILEEVAVRRAVVSDCEVILGFVRALAEFHGMRGAVTIEVPELRNVMFETQPPGLMAFMATKRHRTDGGPLVAAEEVLVGMATFHFRCSGSTFERIVYLEDLFVLPEHRGKGLGLALLRAVIEEGLGRGFDVLQLKVHKNNLAARRMYLGHGAVDMTESASWKTFLLEKKKGSTSSLTPRVSVLALKRSSPLSPMSPTHSDTSIPVSQPLTVARNV